MGVPGAPQSIGGPLGPPNILKIVIFNEKILNNTATQIFTKNGPLAFLPISPNETSVVYSFSDHKSLKKEKSKVIALTDEIKNEISPLEESKVHIFSSAFDNDFFYEKSEKKNHIVYAGSLFRFGKSCSKGISDASAFLIWGIKKQSA